MAKVSLLQKRSARSGTMTISMCVLLCAIAQSLFSQILESNDYEKGYVKDGLKYSVWEYFNANKELELKINHTSGKIYFIKPDTSAFVIFKDGKWREEKLIIYPIPVEGYHNYARKLSQNIRYPLGARREGIEGTVCVMFDVDTTGTPTDYTIVKDIGGDTGQEVLRLLKEIQTPWIPAQIGRTKYSSRFVLLLSFSLGRQEFDKLTDLPLAKVLNLSAARVKRSSASVRMLEMSSNGVDYITINSLQEAIDSEKKVRILKVIGDGLKTLPGSIGSLNNLKFLDLERNQLTELPAEIGKLEKLEQLYLPGNYMKTLPMELAALNRLRVLALSSNEFSEFPKVICDCTELEELDLGYNSIPEIPPCIFALTKLKRLFLPQNRLKTLPPEFFRLKKLNQIVLTGNPLAEEIIDRIKESFPRNTLTFE